MKGGQTLITPPRPQMKGGSGWRQGGQGSFGDSVFTSMPASTGGGRTRRLKRRLGNARRRSQKTYSAGGGRRTRRIRRHRR